MTISPSCAEKIREKYLSRCIVSASPRAWFMCGLPGSGKSSFVRQGLENGLLPKKAFLMDPDGIMEALPGYKIDLAQTGPENAFRKWELPVRTLAYEMLDEARLQKFDIIIDMGHALPESRLVIDSLKAEGYDTKMYYIECPVEICRDRAQKRGRYLPPGMIEERMEVLKANLEYFRQTLGAFEEISGQNFIETELTS